jgi:hypothetical protein
MNTECEHIWVLFYQDDSGKYVVEFRFYCQKCLKFKAIDKHKAEYI